MTVAMAGDGSFPSVPARLQPNPHSWLHFTDLVFIDPVDTGFSRALPGPQGKADPTPYFEVEADLHSLGQFMRRYLTVNGRWPSPKAVAGESYGGQRVAALSKLLMEDYDINLNRAVLISPALRANLPGLDSRYGLISTMTLLPTQAAVAAFHRRNDLPADLAALPRALAEVERYALTDYLTGMANLGRSTPDQKAALFGRVAALTGLDRDLVASQNGRVSAEIFVKDLLRKQYKLLDRYDGTQATDDPLPEHPEFASLDRSLVLLNGVLAAPFQDYLRQQVGYKTDRVYKMLNLLVPMPSGTADQAEHGHARRPGLRAECQPRPQGPGAARLPRPGHALLRVALPAGTERAEHPRRERRIVLRHLPGRAHVLPAGEESRRDVQGRGGVLPLARHRIGRERVVMPTP
jgi:carboxypeptidase C (cathepsin A)